MRQSFPLSQRRSSSFLPLFITLDSRNMSHMSHRPSCVSCPHLQIGMIANSHCIVSRLLKPRKYALYWVPFASFAPPLRRSAWVCSQPDPTAHATLVQQYLNLARTGLGICRVPSGCKHTPHLPSTSMCFSFEGDAPPGILILQSIELDAKDVAEALPS